MEILSERGLYREWFLEELDKVVFAGGIAHQQTLSRDLPLPVHSHPVRQSLHLQHLRNTVVNVALFSAIVTLDAHKNDDVRGEILDFKAELLRDDEQFDMLVFVETLEHGDFILA